jgi:hypothetical protein
MVKIYLTILLLLPLAFIACEGGKKPGKPRRKEVKAAPFSPREVVEALISIDKQSDDLYNEGLRFFTKKARKNIVDWEKVILNVLLG